MTREEYLCGGARMTCPRGNRLPHAKLNPELVLEIRKNRHGLTAKQWAEKLNVHVRTIEGVRSYRTWGHV